MNFRNATLCTHGRAMLLVMIAAGVGFESRTLGTSRGAEAAAAPRGPEATFREGTNFGVAVSPDGRTIVADLQGNLWTLPIAGGTARRITDEMAEAREP